MAREQGMDAAFLERFLHVSEFRERTTRYDLRLALFTDAVAHLLEPMVDQIELEIVMIDARGIQAKHAHLVELERHTTRAAEIAAALGKDGAHLCDGARRVVGRGF